MNCSGSEKNGGDAIGAVTVMTIVSVIVTMPAILPRLTKERSVKKFKSCEKSETGRPRRDPRSFPRTSFVHLQRTAIKQKPWSSSSLKTHSYRCLARCYTALDRRGFLAAYALRIRLNKPGCEVKAISSSYCTFGRLVGVVGIVLLADERSRSV